MRSLEDIWVTLKYFELVTHSHFFVISGCIIDGSKLILGIVIDFILPLINIK